MFVSTTPHRRFGDLGPVLLLDERRVPRAAGGQDQEGSRTFPRRRFHSRARRRGVRVPKDARLQIPVQVRHRARRQGEAEVRAVRERRGGDARRRRRGRGWRYRRVPLGVRTHREGHAGSARPPQRRRRDAEREPVDDGALRGGVPRQSGRRGGGDAVEQDRHRGGRLGAAGHHPRGRGVERRRQRAADVAENGGRGGRGDAAKAKDARRVRRREPRVGARDGPGGNPRGHRDHHWEPGDGSR
mmetsp:Transcript_3079/g.13751  ORF Transcript_3079/g.13751 Transcript_3079/m.13751 type:complete len:243 (+) Transcript_3079:1135-1863(+)